jgi:fluoride exporter
VTLLAVAVAGLAGVLARYGLGTTVSTAGTPWVTLGINLAGSFILGALLPLGEGMSEQLRTGIAVGFCGGFTTFSTFSVEVFFDAKEGDVGFAALYLAASIVGGLLAAAVGYYAGRAINQ